MDRPGHLTWAQRRQVYLVLLGCAMVILAAIVVGLDQTTSTELLGAIGFLAGLGTLIASLPSNGNSQH